MIDTDKYEGHTEGPWVVNNPDDDESLIFSVGALKFVSSANTRLMADAPLLLAEVKRLREQVELLRSLGMGKDGIETIVVDRLNAEVKRLREALDWVRREETRKEADYIWEGVEEILAGDPRWKEMIE